MNYSGPQSCWFNAVLWAQDLRPVSPLSHLVHQEISPNIGAPNVVLLSKQSIAKSQPTSFMWNNYLIIKSVLLPARKLNTAMSPFQIEAEPGHRRVSRCNKLGVTVFWARLQGCRPSEKSPQRPGIQYNASQNCLTLITTSHLLLQGWGGGWENPALLR